MKKRILLCLMCGVMILGITTGCGTTSNNNSNEESNNVNNSEEQNNKTDLSNKLTFVGYNISYPSDASIEPEDYGKIIGTNDYVVFIGAPSVAGIVLDAKDVNEAPELCEQYIIKRLEGRIRSLFNHDSTEQVINKSSKTTKNGIEMLRTEGVFKNTRNNTEVEFVSYYLLAGDKGNMPLYLVAIPMKDSTVSVSKIMDDIASNITKYKG